MLTFLLFTAFVVVPIAELYVFFRIADSVGFLETLAAVVVISATGAWLARHEGFQVVNRIQFDVAQRRVPTTALLDGALVLAGGLLLLTPGFLTDIVGVVLIFPLTRAPIRALIQRRFLLFVFGPTGKPPTGPPRSPPPDDVIDV